MQSLKERFLQVYANVPLNIRDDIVLVLPDRRTVTWDVAFYAIRDDSEHSQIILAGLNDLGII